jgi:hypothetical protein
MTDEGFEIGKLGCWTIVIFFVLIVALIVWKYHNPTPRRAEGEKVSLVRSVEFYRVPDVRHLPTTGMGIRC